jgi:hypothetical protein
MKKYVKQTGCHPHQCIIVTVNPKGEEIMEVTTNIQYGPYGPQGKPLYEVATDGTSIFRRFPTGNNVWIEWK